MPTDPAKIQRWISDVRELRYDDVTYRGHVIDLFVKLPPSVGTAYQAVWPYLKRYHPEEVERIRAIQDEIRENYKNSEQKMWWCAFENMGKHSAVAVPIDCDNVVSYLTENHPEELDRMSRELGLQQ